MPLIVFGAFSFWIPQIVLCAFQNARQPLKLYYIIGMSLSRLALPLYLYGCPSNLLRNAASPLLCVLLSAYLTCQVRTILAALTTRTQSKLVGSRTCRLCSLPGHA